MIKKLAAVVLAVALVGNPLVAQAQAATEAALPLATHVHKFIPGESVEKYLYTRDAGSYTHTYLWGVGPSGGIGEICLVLKETEYYTYVCTEPGCDVTYGTVTHDVDCHTDCGLGDVPLN